jgi:hypothetical protein
MLKNWRFWFAVKRPQNEVLSIEEEEPETTYTIRYNDLPSLVVPLHKSQLPELEEDESSRESAE